MTVCALVGFRMAFVESREMGLSVVRQARALTRVPVASTTQVLTSMLWMLTVHSSASEESPFLPCSHQLTLESSSR